MSVWSSVGTEDVLAIEHTDDANYKGEGKPDIHVDVATAAPWHGLIRLAAYRIERGRSYDESVLLSADAALKLADRLIAAAQRVKAERP